MDTNKKQMGSLAPKGIHVSEEEIRSLEKEAAKDESGNIIIPARNEKGELLPYINNDGVLICPTSGSEEFRHWNHSKKSNAFCFRDILRYVQAPLEDWKKKHYSPMNLPECRECIHGVYETENRARMSCGKRLRAGVFPSGELMCRIELHKWKNEGNQIDEDAFRDPILMAKTREQFELENPNERRRRERKEERENEDKSIVRVRKKRRSMRKRDSNEDEKSRKEREVKERKEEEKAKRKPGESVTGKVQIKKRSLKRRTKVSIQEDKQDKP